MSKKRINKDLYQSLFHSLQSGVAVYTTEDDGDTFILSDANTALEKICNVNRTNIIGKNVQDIFPGIVDMGLLDVIRRVYEEGNPIDHPIAHYCDKQLSFWASNYVYKIETGEVIVIFNDITETKKNAQELKKFKLLFDSSLFGYAITNSKGNLTYVNEYFANSHGYQREDLLGKNISIFHNKEQRTETRQIRNNLKKNGFAGPMIVPHRHRGGTELTMMMTGVVIEDEYNNEKMLAFSAINITEQELIKSEHKLLTAAIEQTADTVVITNKDGTIQYVNPAFEKLTGFSKKEAIGNKPSILKSGLHATDFYENMWATISSGSVWKGRITNKKKDGTLFTEDACISPIVSSKNEIKNYVAVKHDITRELELLEQLQHAVKMEAIGTLAGGIAHDFNNILTAINGFTFLALESLSEGHEAREDLQHVLLSADRAADLVKQILLYSRKEDTDFHPLQPATILKETCDMLKASLPPGIELIYECDENCHVINADPSQIQQILMNLAANATHAMKEHGGTLSLSLANSHPVDDFALPHVVFIVSDSGTGIDNKYKEKIFDPFFTTKAIGEGTGLGLAVVHGIVKSHNGSIDFESQPSHGSTFTIRIPAISEKIIPEPKNFSSCEESCSENILIVDDETEVMQILERILNKAGYHTTCFNNSRKALLHFNKNPTAYDLLLTDYVMPDLDGSELAMLMVQKNKDLEVIICTGHIGSLGKVGDRKRYPTNFLYKPIKREELLRSVRKVLNG